MNAFQPLTPPPPPDRSSARPRRQRQRHRPLATEALVKLSVNGVLAIAAVSALVRLLPYTLTQQAKLLELEAEVTDLGNRVDRLQADLNRQFDPQQAASIMQEQSIRVDPRQRQIVWLNPATADPTSPAQPSASVSEALPESGIAPTAPVTAIEAPGSSN